MKTNSDDRWRHHLDSGERLRHGTLFNIRVNLEQDKSKKSSIQPHVHQPIRDPIIACPPTRDASFHANQRSFHSRRIHASHVSASGSLGTNQVHSLRSPSLESIMLNESPMELPIVAATTRHHARTVVVGFWRKAFQLRSTEYGRGEPSMLVRWRRPPECQPRGTVSSLDSFSRRLGWLKEYSCGHKSE